jgi:hypothetical protein
MHFGVGGSELEINVSVVDTPSRFNKLRGLAFQHVKLRYRLTEGDMHDRSDRSIGKH